jgi:hypothetical protein
VSEPASPPLGTWRPMAAWTAAIVLALGLAWFVGAVVVPVWQVRSVVRAYEPSAPKPYSAPAHYVVELGGPKLAAHKLGLYLKLPDSVASDKPCAIWLLSFCDKPGVVKLKELLPDRDAAVRMAAERALTDIRDILGEEAVK